MFLAYKFRLYPNKSQEILLEKHFGCCRFIYNFLLWFRTMMYREKGKNISWLESQAKIAELKRDKNYSWLKEVNSQSLQLEARHLNQGFKKFFEKSGGYPKKKKGKW